MSFVDVDLPGSFPSIVDLSKVTKLAMYFDGPCQWLRTSSSYCIDLLKRTPNISSLKIHGEVLRGIDLFCSEDACSAIIRHVDPSKLRHLDIHTRNVESAEMLLERFADLISVRFSFPTVSNFAQRILRCTWQFWQDYSIIKENRRSVSIWLGERRNITGRDKHNSLFHQQQTRPSFFHQTRGRTDC